VAHAKEWLATESRNSGGALCPCCNKKEKTVSRKVTAAQAAILVLLHRQHQVGDEVLVSDFISLLPDKELSQTRDVGRLVYWDLLEATSSEKFFRLCDGGHLFVFKGHKITERVWVRDDQIVDRDGKLVDITNVLGTKFDLNTLMHMQLPSPNAQTTIPIQ
jgi:hypothetical protein